MFRNFLFSAVCLALLQSCNPPVRLKPSNPKTGLDSTYYAGVVEVPKSVDLREAQFLAHIKIGDMGVSLDCKYPDVLDLATREAQRIGGNLLVITEHTQNRNKSLCHRIKADIYRIGSLEGLEPRIPWHPARPLMAGDLRGKAPQNAASLPPLDVAINCRIAGDYFKDAILRTETLFFTDSTYRSGDTLHQAIQLRRAQLHFDLAELHARKLKSRLLDLGPDIRAITGQYRELTLEQQERLRQERQAFDADLQDSDNKSFVLDSWQARIQAQLLSMAALEGDQVVDLRKKRQ